MKFLDFTTLFETEPASLAVLSTFQFDADFFERRILRCPALVKARRILVFMDSGQWFNLLRQDAPARFLNRRYLVVPVRPKRGVFHPKLNLLVTQQGGQIQCGSNNLTRSGCSSNLELLNSVRIDLEGDDDEPICLAQEAYSFFKLACDDTEEHAGRIAREWLEELPTRAPWLVVPRPPSAHRKVILVHTYEGSLWERLAAVLDASTLQRLLVLSPFYDLDAEMVRRLRGRWPKCQIELVVQQQTTNLPVAQVKELGTKVSLSELRNSSRRLHAKLVAWESSTGSGCLVGSANFTTAAFDSRNVEACLLLPEARDALRTLFDKDLAKRPVRFEEFTPGTDQEPRLDDTDLASLRLTSALLADGELRVAYRHRLKLMPTSLRVAIRTVGEQRPRALFNLPNQENGMATLGPWQTTLMEAHGSLLASLVAETENGREESPPIWVIQEARLTYEPSGEGSSVPKSRVEETGEGLPEYLEELGKRDGVAAVVEYLHHLNIRFNDGAGGTHGERRFRVRIRDPFHPDVAPEWLLRDQASSSDLEAAIDEFVDRHEKTQRALKYPTTASAVLWITPEVADSAVIRKVEVPGIIARIQNDDAFFVVPVAAGGLDYKGAAQAVDGQLRVENLEQWNIRRVTGDPIAETEACTIANRVLRRRMAAVDRVTPKGDSLRLGIYTRTPPPFQVGASLTLDWTHRFADREATPADWKGHLLPALKAVTDALRTQAPGRVIEATGLPAIPAAVALGCAFLAPGGLRILWRQQKVARADQLWSLNAPREAAGFQARTVGGHVAAHDLAVLVSVAANAEPAFGASKSKLPEFRAVTCISPTGRCPHDLATPGQAVDVAFRVVEEIRHARDAYSITGVIHLFMAVPVGLAMLIGQLLNTFGEIQTYEHLPINGVGRYREAVLITPSA